MDDIKAVLKSNGWQEILHILNEEMESSLATIATTQTDKEIAVQYIGKIEAQKIIRTVLRKLEKMAEEQVSTPQIYR